MARKTTAGLTELEGSVLVEIGHRGNQTRFKVRRAFETSPSSSWSGSAGAVYPAIKRLIEAGLIVAGAPETGLRTRSLSLSSGGKTALEQWFSDVAAACSTGADPFRSRAGLWQTLDPARRAQVVVTMLGGVERELAILVGRTGLDPVEDIGNQLAIRLQQMRRDWLNQFERGSTTDEQSPKSLVMRGIAV